MPLFSFEEYIKKVAEHYSTNTAILVDNEIKAILDDIKEIFKGKNDRIVNLHQYVCKFKDKVTRTFDQLQTKMNELTAKILNEEKERILKNFEAAGSKFTLQL